MKTSNQIMLVGSGQMFFLTFPPNPPGHLHSLPLFLPPPLLGSPESSFISDVLQVLGDHSAVLLSITVTGCL